MLFPIQAFAADEHGLPGAAMSLWWALPFAGLLLSMLAMLAGLLELRSIDSSSDAMRVATWHVMIMATVWVCFLSALLLSVSTGFDQATASLGEAACAVAGFVLMAVGGWLGGRLVYEFGIAVQKDANL